MVFLWPCVAPETFVAVWLWDYYSIVRVQYGKIDERVGITLGPLF